MKKYFFYALIAVFLFGCYFFFAKKSAVVQTETKQAAIVLKTHSDTFNHSINQMIDTYLGIKDAFVEDDTANIKSKTTEFCSVLESMNLKELEKDSSGVYETVNMTKLDIISNAKSLLQQKDITEMRRDFSAMTDVMYPTFFNAIKYEGPALYLQNCPMAFNDTEPANWISNNKEIVNPYMGKHHPKYQSGMLHCGEIKDTIKSK
jgi:hypothetical protein